MTKILHNCSHFKNVLALNLKWNTKGLEGK